MEIDEERKKIQGVWGLGKEKTQLLICFFNIVVDFQKLKKERQI